MALSSRYSSSRPVLNATRARSGRYGRHVFWVLLASTILAALGLFFAWGLRSDDLASTEAANRPTAAEAAGTQAPEPAPVIPQPEQAAR